jgi:hypothetical protein
MAPHPRITAQTANILGRQLAFDLYASRTVEPELFLEPRVVRILADGTRDDVVAEGLADVHELLASAGWNAPADDSEAVEAAALLCYESCDCCDAEYLAAIAVDRTDSAAVWTVPIRRKPDGEPILRRPTPLAAKHAETTLDLLRAWLG